MQPLRRRFPALAAILASFVARTGAQSSEPKPPGAHERMVAELHAIAEKSAVDDFYVGTRAVADLQRRLAELPSGAPATQRWKLLRELGVNELRVGEFRASVDHLTAANQLSDGLRSLMKPEARREAMLELAVAWLRLGETQNCIAHHCNDSCIFPLRADAVHGSPEGSTNASAVLKALLREYPSDWTARWLLNLAAMTLGTYPKDVPPEFLIPESAFASGEPFKRFPEVASSVGLGANTLAGAAVIDDFDGDGKFEIVTTSWEPTGLLQIFHRENDGQWIDQRDSAGVQGIDGGLNALQADYDNDGDLDLLVLRGAWTIGGGRVPSSLLRNDGHGHFRDVSFDAHLDAARLPTQCAAWADFDNDGDLDLYIGVESTDAIRAGSLLFWNQGDGTFVEGAAKAGVTNDRFTKGVSVADYDHDGFPDLYVSNLGAPNRLYHNQHDGTFVDVAQEAHVEGPIASFPCWFFDFDNDGNQDLFVAPFYRSVEPMVKSYLGLPPGAEGMALYKGDGHGHFENVAEKVGLTRATVVMGANFGDIDDDGWLDIFLSTGYPAYEGLMPKLMYRNHDGAKFVDITTAGGFGHLQKGHGVAFADVDGDGDTDLFVEIGGAFPGDSYPNALFENPGFGHHWIEVRLVGVQSNSFGVGAEIRCDVEENGKRRSIYRTVSSGGSFGANPLEQHIGLGAATRVLKLEVHWPTSGVAQSFENVAVDRKLAIVEGDAQLFDRAPEHVERTKKLVR